MPVDARASEVVDAPLNELLGCNIASDSEVRARARHCHYNQWCDACCLVRFAILRGLVQMAAAASSITQLASIAWPDVTSSPRSDSGLFEALQPQMKRAETQLTEVASDLQASQREGVVGGAGLGGPA